MPLTSKTTLFTCIAPTTYDRVKTSSEIAWLYEEVTPPEPPTPTEKTGAPVFNGYTTDGIHAYFIEIQESEPSTIYYRVQFGQNGEFTEWAEYEDILSFTQERSRSGDAGG